MLGKLIKYDLKYVYKQLIIFYIIMFSLAIIARLTNVENPPFIVKFIHEFAQGACYGFSLGGLINASMRIWARFKTNLYGDESYLTHTLPVSSRTLWASKFLSSLIVLLISTLVIFASVFILFAGSDLIAQLHLDNPDTLRFYLILIAAIILQVLFIIQSGFMGLIIGHRQLSNRTAISVILGLVFYSLGGTIIFGVNALILLIFNPDLFNLLMRGSSEFVAVDNMITLISGISITYVVLIAATYFINDKLLSRGVNVD